MTDPFELLGVDRATVTQAQVKAAYAKLLKVTRPEDDRDAFMALRAAFETARGVAKANDARPPTEAPKPSPSAPPPKPEPIPEPIEWHYDEALDWEFNTSPQGKLVEDTIRWMIAGGPDAIRFTADVSERLIGFSTNEAEDFRAQVLEFLFVASDPDNQAYLTPHWEAFEGVKPDWLNDGLINALQNDLDLLRSAPTSSYLARSFNTIRNIFAAALSSDALPTPLDVADIYEREQTETRADDHGSYFDKSAKEWVDLSPVSVALRDIEAAFDLNADDTARTVRGILDREDLQSLDEFQDLDARLRELICRRTEWDHSNTAPKRPDWLTEQIILMLDDTFGWSRHFGHQSWQREQYAWLHQIIAKHRDINNPAHQFQALRVEALEKEKGRSLSLFGWIFETPRTLLVTYFGYRFLQFMWRLIT